MPAHETASPLRALARANAPLDIGEERELVRRTKTGDARARDALVRGHMRLVISTVRKLCPSPDEDLIAEGVLGLLEAIERFDPGYEVRLVTYAAPWIRMRAQRYILSNRRIVSAPDTRAARKVLARIGRVERRLFATTGEASPDAIAKEIGVEPGDVAQVMVAMRSRDASVGTRHEDGATVEPADATPSPEESVAYAEVRELERSAVARALDTLPPRERSIVLARALADERRSLGDLARSLSLSSERVRQLEIRALAHLGRELSHLVAA